jgi:hypothetical protein
MQMGRRLLKDLAIELAALDHKVFAAAQAFIQGRGDAYFAASVRDIEEALRVLYGKKMLSPQQLSATFRRGDLIELLAAVEV